LGNVREMTYVVGRASDC